MTSGRAASWTRTTRSAVGRRESSAPDARRDRSCRRSPPATTPRRPGSHDARRISATALGRDARRRSARRRAAAASASSVHASNGRPPIGGAACRRPPSASTAPGGTTTTSAPSPVAGSGAVAQSRRGWAKIIRPATVWRTRVTFTSTSLVDEPGAALDDDHRPVIEEADALAGLLALLDHLDPELLAGQDGGLHGVGQRVDVQDPHALELGDPVQVVVVGQDRRRLRRLASATSLASTSATSGRRHRRSRRGSRGSCWIRGRISRPRRPRFRRRASELSAMCWSSSRTNRGTTSVP